MTPATWPALLQECWRITRPGGYLRLTECEEPGTNSEAFETIYGLILQAMKRSGQQPLHAEEKCRDPTPAWLQS